MTYATIQTGPYSTAQGILLWTDGHNATIKAGFGEVTGRWIGADRYVADQFIDDQDHDMTPVMHRRDF